MGEWKITVLNKTGDGGLSPVNIDFMLYQVNATLGVDSCSNAWKVAQVGYPASVGPIVLTTRVQFYVIDQCHGNPRKTGPFDVTFGQTITVSQKRAHDAPQITFTDEPPAPEGQIEVLNKQGNAKPLEMALYKDERPLLSLKNVRPADAVNLSVEPALYIARVDLSSVKEGDFFKAVVQVERSTRFKLFPAKSEVTIVIIQLHTGELQFVEQILNRLSKV